MSQSPPLSPSSSASHPSSSLSPASAYAQAHPDPSAGGALHTRARSGSASRTWDEAQAEEQRQRQEDNQRAREMAQDGTGDAGAISAGEIRAEMETLLSLRRRSLSQPASVDPDLPPPSPTSPTQPSYPHPPSHPGRPQLSLQIANPATSPSGAPLSPTAPTAAETGTLVRRKSSISTRLPSDHPLPSPPLPSPTGSSFSASSPDGAEAAHTSQDLFWLPASLHPELAPQEFKAFIREQTRPDALARRTSTGGRGGYAGAGGGRVDRKKSMLRGEYKPRQGDGVEEEGQPRMRERRPEGLSRTASEGSKRTTTRVDFEELTIRDLQRLEELAAYAEAENARDGEEEGERLGRVLRRSLSLNPNLVAAAAAGAHLSLASEPTASDQSLAPDSDSPLIVHSPGQILRRTARTKIRKAGLVGDGGGHRFGPSRRVRTASGDLSAHGTSVEDDDSIGGNTSVDSLESGEAMQVASEIVDGDPGGRSIASSPSSDNQHEVQYFEDAPSIIIIEDFPPAAIDGAWLSDEPSKPTSPVDLNAPLPPPPPPAQGPPPVRPPLHSPPSLPAAPSPSSADYDWATHHQPQQLQQQQLPPAQPYVPPPPVPAPLPERKDSVSHLPPPAPSSSSSRSSSMSDNKKKSGWARLGLSVKPSEEKKKGKGKDKGEKEMEKVVEAAVKQQQLDREKEARDTRDREEKERKEREKEQSKEKEGGFFGGLFGKRKSEQEPVAPPTPSPPPEIRTPPPPPTASGALAPDGRYINFYRLPIHVERAVYRLSHIKLANPRRPLYEQVLISNLMFWYLSIINKPVAPPPAAPAPVPIPVPQMRGGSDDSQQQQHAGHSSSSSKEKRGGLSKPAGEGQQGRRGANRSAEMPVKQPQFEQQNRQIEQEYGGGGQGGGHHQQQHSQNHPPSHSQPHQQQHHSQASSSHHASPNPHPSSPSSIPHVVVAPSSPTSSASPPLHSTSRSPDRASAPADMYRGSSTSSSSLSSSDDDEDDDDRPLGSLPAHRESYPPHRPIPVSSYPKHDSGFQVTSRKVSPTPSRGPRTSTGSAEEQKNRRVSSVSQISTGSFDASDIIDAYSGSASGAASPATSPVLSFKEVAPVAEGLAPSLDSGEVAHAPLFGNVAPRRRGDSLVNRGNAEDSKTDELVRVRSKSPPLRQISPVSAGGREYL